MKKSNLMIALIIVLWICFVATGITLIVQLSMEGEQNPPVDPPNATVSVASEEDLMAALGEQESNVKFADDIEITGNNGVLQHSGNSTIDLDGHNLTGVIENSGSLTISNTSNEDSVVSADGDATIVNQGNLEIEGNVSVSGSIQNEDTGTLTISGTSNGNTVIYSDYGHSIYNEGQLEIDDNVTVYCNRSIRASAIYNAEGGTAAIRGGTFLYKEDTALTELAWYVIFNASNATITELTNATIKGDTHASLVENFGVIEEIADVDLENSVNVIKNEPSGVINMISSGTFTMTKGYENNASIGNSSVILNSGEIEEIAGGDFVIADTVYPVTAVGGRLAVITNNGNINNISGGTFRSETTQMYDIVYNKGSLNISGGDFSAEDGIVFVIFNAGELNISDGDFYCESTLAITYSNDITTPHVIFTHAAKNGSETVYGTTNITGGTFILSDDAPSNSKVVWSATGLSSKAQTNIYGGTFYGDMNVGTVGPTSPIRYNIVISGGVFDKEVWSSKNGGVWKVQGIESDCVVIYNDDMYRVVEKKNLTHTDSSADGYFEAIIPSANATKHLDMYYASASLAMDSVFEMMSKGFKAHVKLYVSDATDVVLPLGEKLTIECAAEGVEYTGTVSAPAGSNSTTSWVQGETDKIKIYQCNISAEDATVYIVRDEQYIYYNNLSTAFSNAQDGDRIVVLESHTLTAKAELLANNVTLDLNGKTIYGTTNNSITIDINGAQNFTIEDSIGDGAVLAQNTSTSASYATVYLRSTATVTITGGSFGHPDLTDTTKYWLSFYSNFTGTLTITDGTFVGKINGASATKLIIQGGTYTVSPTAYIGGNGTNNAVLNKDGTYYIVKKADLQHDNPSNGNYYAAVIPTIQPDTYADCHYASADTAINDVVSLSTGYDALRMVVRLYASSSQDVAIKAYTTLTIYYMVTGIQYNGTVTAATGYTLVGPSSLTGDNSGVYYEAQLPADSDKKKVEVWHGDEVRYYDTLANAFKYAQDGDTIKLRTDVTTATLTVNNITLDLNGFTISGTTTALTVNGARNLTIKDSVGTGQIKTTSKFLNNTAGAIILQNGATVTIESGEFINTNGAGYNCFVIVGGDSFTGKVTIKGGTFTGTFWNATANTDIVIESGSFKTDTDLTAYVATTSTVTGPDEDGYYTVTRNS